MSERSNTIVNLYQSLHNDDENCNTKLKMAMQTDAINYVWGNSKKREKKNNKVSFVWWTYLLTRLWQVDGASIANMISIVMFVFVWMTWLSSFFPCVSYSLQCSRKCPIVFGCENVWHLFVCAGWRRTLVVASLYFCVLEGGGP